MRYFFDIRDKRGLMPDDEGADFHTLEDALSEAKASAKDIAVQNIRNGQRPDSSCVEVRDERGQVVAALTVAEVLAHPHHPQFRDRCPDITPGMKR